MSRRIVPLSLLILLFVSACNVRMIQGSGNVEIEKREIGDFDEVSICCGMHLTLEQGDKPALEIEADDNLLPEISTKVRNGGELRIDFGDDGWVNANPSETIKVRVTAVSINKVEVSGGGRLVSSDLDTKRMSIDLSGGSRALLDEVRSDSFNVEVSGGGRVEVEVVRTKDLNVDLSGGSQLVIEDLVSAESLDLEVSGGGRATISGDVLEQRVNLSGGSDYSAGGLKSDRTYIEGNGDAEIWAFDELVVDLSGGAHVEYFGEPDVTQDLSGGSTLKAKGGR